MVLIFKVVYDAFMQGLRGKAPTRGDQCVACSSTNIMIEGDAVYSCLDCGYEGGSGRARLKRTAEIKRINALPPEKKLALASQKLTEARSMIIGAQGTLFHQALEDVLQMVDEDIRRFMGETDFAISESELVGAMGDLILADQAMDTAARCMGVKRPSSARFATIFGQKNEFIDNLLDSLDDRLYATSTLVHARVQTHSMIEWIDSSLADLN